MAHSARVHRMVCERRLEAGEPQLPTPEDRYNYAIALINRGEPRQALRHLEEALRDMPDADHLHYAMAICLGLVGEMDRAASELRRAIALQPRNRTAARNDPDFQPFASAPQIKSILNPETAG
ncbi:MAG: tetratricopeptide repeat protein [bacterium]|nr:tetratricopeptide repeat protein [bacterium]